MAATDGKSEPVDSRLQDAVGSAQRAIAMREEALDARLRLWRARLRRQPQASERGRLLELSLDAVLSVTSADFANIQLCSAQGRGLVLRSHRGFGQRYRDFFNVVDGDASASGLAWREKRSVVVEDVLFSPIFIGSNELQVLLDADVRAMTSTPLVRFGRQPIGMVSAHFRQPRAHVDSDLVRFERLAEAIACMLDGRELTRRRTAM